MTDQDQAVALARRLVAEDDTRRRGVSSQPAALALARALLAATDEIARLRAREAALSTTSLHAALRGQLGLGACPCDLCQVQP
jgi:hypothetical protein